MRYLFAFLLLLAFSACEKEKRDTAQAVAETPPAPPEEKKLNLRFEPFLDGATKATDIQFAVTDATIMVVLRQTGEAMWRDMRSGRTAPFFTVAVESAVELGLLSIAFHPDFSENGRFFVYYTPRGEKMISRVAEWSLPGADFYKAAPTETAVLLELEQPFPNHNGGQLAFGPDGYLYFGLGDGGSAGDPLDHGQNKNTLFGSILRLDVNAKDSGKAYAIPQDNPFVGDGTAKPEIFAFGLRNPWRMSFDSLGRLWTGDVGQNEWEEIDLVEPGANYGWNVLEGTHCFDPPVDCDAMTEGMSPPVYEYNHNEGYSVTGGYTYEGDKIPDLKGAYVFGDLNGRIWALQVPEESATPSVIFDLGSVDAMPSTFGRSPDGELWLADYRSGKVFRIDPP